MIYRKTQSLKFIKRGKLPTDREYYCDNRLDINKTYISSHYNDKSIIGFLVKISGYWYPLDCFKTIKRTKQLPLP